MTSGFVFNVGTAVTSGIASGTLFLWVALQGVIDDTTALPLFIAVGMAVVSFTAGWRLRGMFHTMRDADRKETRDLIAGLEKRIEIHLEGQQQGE